MLPGDRVLNYMKSNKTKFNNFRKAIEKEIFTFTQKDDKNILSFHTGQLTIASIMKLYSEIRQIFPVKGGKTKNASVVRTRF